LPAGKPTDPLWRESVDGGADCDGHSADVIATATATFPVTAVRDHLGGGRPEKGNGRAGTGSGTSVPQIDSAGDYKDRERENRIAPLPAAHNPPASAAGRRPVRASGGPEQWARWADRWYDTSTLTPRVRGSVRATLLKAGRWLEAEHPEAADPASWTRQTCAAWIAALDRMNVGDYAQRTAGLGNRLGKPLEAPSKAAQLSAVRTFFRDCQEWEWLPRRFDPQRALGTPRTIAALLGPDPRVIADEVWAKLMWAGINLQIADLPQSQAGNFYDPATRTLRAGTQDATAVTADQHR
jgi:hypothetical protein